MNKFKIGDKVRRVRGGDPLEDGEVYTVSSLHYSWIGVKEFDDPLDDSPFAEMNFELVESAPVEQPLCPVHEWLMKLGYVISTNDTISGLEVNLKTKEMFICTDFGDITGITQVIDYVNHNYAVKIKQEVDKRKQELEDKRLKVLAELSEIDQELGLYNP